MFSGKRKRTWCCVREPEAPVPDTADGLQKAEEAATKSGPSLFETKDLYDCVRDVSERVLVCPSTDVSGDVAAICAMARDVCSKPVAIMGHSSLPALLPRLRSQGIVLGTCDFGRKTELVDDLEAAIRGWDDRDIAGVILIVVGSEPVERPERVRAVIRVTKDASKFTSCPVVYSPPRFWKLTAENVVHKGSRPQVVAALQAAWAGKAWNAEEKVPGPDNPIECPICMESGANVVLSCCTGAYCWDCMQPWIDRAESEYYDPEYDAKTCPSCRREMDYKTFHVVVDQDDVDPAREVIMID
jgi:hypothetical protein